MKSSNSVNPYQPTTSKSVSHSEGKSLLEEIFWTGLTCLRSFSATAAPIGQPNTEKMFVASNSDSHYYLAREMCCF